MLTGWKGFLGGGIAALAGLLVLLNVRLPLAIGIGLIGVGLGIVGVRAAQARAAKED